MAKKHKLELTEKQLLAVLKVASTIEAMLGVGSDFDEHKKDVKLIDKMLQNNGYKR
jgi:hypothetical protein